MVLRASKIGRDEGSEWTDKDEGDVKVQPRYDYTSGS